MALHKQYQSNPILLNMVLICPVRITSDHLSTWHKSLILSAGSISLSLYHSAFKIFFYLFAALREGIYFRQTPCSPHLDQSSHCHSECAKPLNVEDGKPLYDQ